LEDNKYGILTWNVFSLVGSTAIRS